MAIENKMRWRPETGCYPCPICNGTATFGGVNPFPGFADASGGYYSVPMGTFYLPLFSAANYGGYLIGEIEKTQIATFLAIEEHERSGHLLQTHHQAKYLQRLAALRAWRAIWEITSPGSSTRWSTLRRWNGLIGQVALATVFVEELFATFFGVQVLLEAHEAGRLPEISVSDIRKTENEMVGQHTRRTFGGKFRVFYGEINRLFEAVSKLMLPFQILAEYCQDILSADSAEQDLGLSVQSLTRENCEKRLRDGLEILEAIPNARGNMQTWQTTDWMSAFGARSREFREWSERRAEVRQILTAHFRDAMVWWNERNLGAFDPEVGMMMPALQAGGPKAFGSEPGLFHPVRGMKYGLDSSFAFHYLDVDAVPPAARAAFAESLVNVSGNANHSVEVLARKIEAARLDHRLLVLIQPQGTEAGFGFFPEDHGRIIGIVPTPHVVAHFTGSTSRDESETLVSDVKRSASAVAFFEGLRLQAATERGVRCPIARYLPGEHARFQCCARVADIIAFWEAGKRTGLPSDTWAKPIDCLYHLPVDP